jgi:hypothetical protein
MVSFNSALFYQPPYTINKNLNPEKNSSSHRANPFMRYIALAYMSNPQSPKGVVPTVVALEVLRKNGVDIDKLIKLITAGVGAEFTTYYYYTILRMHCIPFLKKLKMTSCKKLYNHNYDIIQ